MSLRDLIALVASNLRRRKGRVLMTTLGVIVGTAAVIVLVSLGAGLQRQALASLSSGLTEIRLTGGASDRVVDERVVEQIEELPGVSWVATLEPVIPSVDVQTGRMCSAFVRAVGVDPEQLALLGFEAAEGTLELERGEVLLGARIAERLIASSDRMGGERAPSTLHDETLWLYVSRFGEGGATVERSLRVRVAGVLAPRGSVYDSNVYIPRREALELNGWFTGQRRDPARQGYAEVIVRVDDVEQTAAVEGQLAALGLNVFSDRQYTESVSAYFDELQAALGGIAAVSLLVAAFSIANTMLMALYERTREIGLLKALGASSRDVMLVFVGESGSIGLLGGVSGTLVGLAINGLVNLAGTDTSAFGQMMGLGANLRAFTPLWLPPFAVGFAVLVGVVSGVYPARRAARLDPIEALRA